MMAGSKNKGDWSEFYVLLYLLGTRKLYAADEHLEKMDKYFFPIRKILRDDEPKTHVEFILSEIDRVKIYLNSELTREMSSREFLLEARQLYRDILRGKSSFSIPHAEEFLDKLSLRRLAAPSSAVTDITVELHDTYTGIDQIMGFSIKSYIGARPTLLNASEATNFIFEISGLSGSEAQAVNSLQGKEKIMDRFQKIHDLGGKLHYLRPANDVFFGNLIMIDSRMHEILACLLEYSYRTNEKNCRKIISYLEATNPLHFAREGLYEYKFKQFLCAKALGMNPSRKWTGEDEANGGYIVAKANGDVLAYHLYNRDKFKQYLFDQTELDRGSTTRHNYATIFEENGKLYIRLNLQIRFKEPHQKYGSVRFKSSNRDSIAAETVLAYNKNKSNLTHSD